MTSQLNVDTIVDKAGSGGTNVKVGNTSTYVADGGSATQNLVQGLVKSSVNFNGTGTIATRDSLNISSLTDNGTGDYSSAFTNSFANINYNHSGMSGDGGTSMRVVNQNGNAHTPTTGDSRYQIAYVNGTLDDPFFAGITTNGDLA